MVAPTTCMIRRCGEGGELGARLIMDLKMSERL